MFDSTASIMWNLLLMPGFKITAYDDYGSFIVEADGFQYRSRGDLKFSESLFDAYLYIETRRRARDFVKYNATIELKP